MIVLRKRYTLLKTHEFQDWFHKEALKSQAQIDTRLFKIITEGYFGDHKFLTDEIWELEWVNGRRLYYAYLAEFNLILLLGGNKNGQNKDITKAKKIFKKFIYET